MSYYLQIGPAGFFQVASNSGWNDFTRWVDSISVEDCPELSHLCDWGWSQKPGEVTTELGAIAKKHPPKDSTLGATVDGMLELLRNNAKDANTITVTDGIGEGDGGDETEQ